MLLYLRHNFVVFVLALKLYSKLAEKTPCAAYDLGKVACMCKLADIEGAIAAMKNAIDSGRFGKLLHADAYMKWFRPADYYQSDPWRSLRRAGAGVTVQQAFHYIDLLQYLVGPAAKVEAKQNQVQ